MLAPAVNVFWTPGYWGWVGGFYAWHAGYWGPHVGFYGGVNYGYGYTGVGYGGGRWEGGAFRYNRAVNNINVVNIHNTYNTVIVNNNSSRVSFNGGDRGIRAQPNAREIAAARDSHMGPTRMQEQHVQAAREDRSQRFSQNRGNPANAAMSRPSAAGKPMMRAPDAATRSAQGHMPSSGYAPHADNGQRNGPRTPQVHGAVNNRIEPPRGNDRPSSSYAPRERPQNPGGAPQGMRQEAPRAMNPNAMRGPQHMGGGENRRSEGPRAQPEHRREER